MSRSRPRWPAIIVGALLSAACLVPRASAGDPLRAYRKALKAELEVLVQAVELERGVESLRKERESLAFAETVLEHHGRESLRRLDAYGDASEERDRLTRRRARAMYKLSRGGMLRLAFEPAEDGSDPSERIVRGRTIRQLVRHDLRELEVHRRAEDRASAELLTASRELTAVSSLHMIHAMQDAALRAAGDELMPEVRSTRRHRRRIDLDDETGRHERRLLTEISKQRRALAYGRGLDLLDPRSLVRPVPGRVVGRFGDYEDRIMGLQMHRNGVEIRASRRDRVRAIAPGEVAMVGELPGYDHVVVVDHGGGYLSLTGRLLGVTVAEGDEVDEGQVLGAPAPKAVDDGLGQTVYLELRHGERPIDPLTYLRRRHRSGDDAAGG